MPFGPALQNLPLARGGPASRCEVGTRQVNHGVDPVEGPSVDLAAIRIPGKGSAVVTVGAAPERDDRMPLGGQKRHQAPTDQAGRPGHKDLQARSILIFAFHQ